MSSSEAGEGIIDQILGPVPGIDLASWQLLLLGVAVEQSVGGLRPHGIGEQWEPGAVLGYLLDKSWPLDKGSRALLLLGVVVERSGRPMEDVVERLADDGWAMSKSDKALVLLLAIVLQPKRAIDAGTFLGGSATTLSSLCGHVVTIDMDPARAANVEHLRNVEFRSGLAQDVLADVLAEDAEAELVLLDADHGEEGIAAEVRAVLDRPGAGVRAILVHDSAMPSCRRGLDSIDWHDETTVLGATLDFLPGVSGVDGEVGGMALIWTRANNAP